MKKLSKLDKQVMSAIVPVEQIDKAMHLGEEWRKDNPGKRPPKDFALLMIARQGVDSGLSQTQTLAMFYRIISYARLVESGEMDRWSNGKTEDGAVLISEAVFPAIARARLEFKQGNFRLNVDDFNRLALEASETDGRA